MAGGNFCIGLVHNAIANGLEPKTRRIERAECAGCACIKCRHDSSFFDCEIRENCMGRRWLAPCVMENLVGSGGHLHRLVEAAAVDVGHFGSHRAQVGGELSAMMYAMVV